MEKNNQQLCMLGVVFTADNDEAAIAVKKKIVEATKDIPDVKVDFRLSDPTRRPT